MATYLYLVFLLIFLSTSPCYSIKAHSTFDVEAVEDGHLFLASLATHVSIAHVENNYGESFVVSTDHLYHTEFLSKCKHDVMMAKHDHDSSFPDVSSLLQID